MSLLRCKKLDYIPADETHHKGPAFVRFVQPEMEEKPVVQAITASSEDVHGGDESTSSIPFSPSASTQPAVEQREGTGQTRELSTPSLGITEPDSGIFRLSAAFCRGTSSHI